MVGVVLGLLLVPQFVAIGAPSVALPAIGRALGVPFAATAWIIAAWALASAVAMPLVGRLADRWGVRRLMVASGVLLAAGSLLAAVSPSMSLLVLGRLVGGFGAGGGVVVSYATVDGRLQGASRVRALAIIAAFGGTASGAGTLVGGALTEWLGWRAVIAVPAVGLLALLPAARLAPTDRDHQQRLDVTGAGLLAVIGAAIITLLQSQATRLPWPVVAVLAAVTVICGALLWRRIRRHPDGFVPRTVVTAPGYLAAGFVGLTIVAGYYGLFYAAPELLEHTFGWSALIVGLALLPAALCSLLAARVVGRLATRVRPWLITAVLAALTTVGLAGASLLTDTGAVIAAVAIVTAGFAGAQAVLVGLAPSLVPDAQHKPALGLFNFLFYGGSAIGPAAVGGLSTVSMPLALGAVAVLPAVGVVVSLIARPGSHHSGDEP